MSVVRFSSSSHLSVVNKDTTFVIQERLVNTDHTDSTDAVMKHGFKLLTVAAHGPECYSNHFVCVCVCVSAVFWLHKKFIQHLENCNRLYAKRKRFSTL